MKIKYLGHSCFQFELGGKKIIVDPFITGNPANPDDKVDGMEADYIMLTHAHGDHVLDVEAIAAHNPDVELISNFEIITHYKSKGIEGHSLNHGGKFTFDFGTVKYVNAIHSSTFPDNSPGGNPGGFVIWNDEVSFYIAGDTALTTDMKLIPMTCPPLDFAILPVGDYFTMGYEDAVIAADFIRCDMIIGCHFDTFGFIEIDHEKAKDAFKTRGKELILPNVHDVIAIK